MSASRDPSVEPPRDRRETQASATVPSSVRPPATPSTESNSDGDDADRSAGRHAGFELLVLGFSLLAVGLLILQYLAPVGEETVRLLEWSDVLLCVVFFGDFVRNLVIAPDRRRYLLRSGWLDLASSVPAVDALRLARVGRVLRIVRVIRVLVLSRELGKRLRESPRENALLTAAFACTVLVITGAVAVLEFEVGRGNITTASDALWWALSTISTVGYGDHAPVTGGGRVVGVVLMLAGVGTFGLMAGLLASTLLGPTVEPPPEVASAEDTRDATNVSDALRALHDEVRSLRAEVASLQRPPEREE